MKQSLRELAVLAAVAAGWSALLLLPSPYRDAMLAVALGGIVLYAWRNYARVWFGVIALLPLLRLSGELFQLNGVTASRVLIVTLALVLLVRSFDARSGRRVAHTNGFRWFGLFVAVNVIAALRTGSVASLLSALTYVEPLLFFVISFVLASTQQLPVRAMLRAWLLGAVLVAVVGFYEIVTQQAVGAALNPALKNMLDTYMSGWDSNRFGLGGRIGSLIAQPVFASLYWVMIWAAAYYFFRKHARAWQIQIGLALVCGIFVLLTGTRTGLLAFGAAFLVWLIFGVPTRRQRLFALGTTGLAVLLCCLIFPQVGDYLWASVNLGASSIATRNVVWRAAVTVGLLRIFQNHWLLGYGPGLVQKQAVAGQLPKVDGEYSLGGLENQYATILADGGIVAGIAYGLFIFGVVRDVARLLRAPQGHAYGVLLLAMFAAYFVFAATEMTLVEIPNMLLMGLYGAIVAEFENDTAANARGAADA